MPAYNSEKYIGQAIQSVLSQTCQDWELLVIDDCSSDQTAAVVGQIAQKDPRIRYYKNSVNLGAAGSRNYAVSQARGEWIAFLDSDDCWSSNKLQLQLQLADRTGAEFVFSGSAFINVEGKKLPYYLSVPECITYRRLLKQNVISCSSVLIRRELIQKYPMHHAADMHEDFAAWLQILRDTGMSAYAVDKPLLIYRISAASKSGNKIKAAKMTYRVYRYVGLSLLSSVYYWLHYSVRSLRKYRHLY